MKRFFRKPSRSLIPMPTTTCKADFRRRVRSTKPDVNPMPVERVPRVARLLALAHKIDGMIRSRELKNWAEAARLIGITRPRMTQIANLLLLAPEVHEGILDTPPTLRAQGPATEHRLRAIVIEPYWKRQRRA